MLLSNVSFLREETFFPIVNKNVFNCTIGLYVREDHLLFTSKLSEIYESRMYRLEQCFPKRNPKFRGVKMRVQ
jgi:hypothetical protein